MANTCIVFLDIEGSREDINLFLSTARLSPPEDPNDLMRRTWYLGKYPELSKHIHKEYVAKPCGWYTEVSKDAKELSLSFVMEVNWSLKEDMVRDIANLYPKLHFCFVEEECGNEVYNRWDVLEGEVIMYNATPEERQYGLESSWREAFELLENTPFKDFPMLAADFSVEYMEESDEIWGDIELLARIYQRCLDEGNKDSLPKLTHLENKPSPFK